MRNYDHQEARPGAVPDPAGAEATVVPPCSQASQSPVRPGARATGSSGLPRPHRRASWVPRRLGATAGAAAAVGPEPAAAVARPAGVVEIPHTLHVKPRARGTQEPPERAHRHRTAAGRPGLRPGWRRRAARSRRGRTRRRQRRGAAEACRPPPTATWLQPQRCCDGVRPRSRWRSRWWRRAQRCGAGGSAGGGREG